MGTELPQYYKQQNNVSQAQRQAGYAGQAGAQAGYTGQAGLQAANNTSQAYLQSTQPGGQNYNPYQQTTQQVYNPLNVNYSPGATYGTYQGSDLSQLYGNNPFVADFSNPNVFNNADIWNNYPNATNTQIAGSYGGGTTPASSMQPTSALPSRVYRADIPISDISNWTQPDLSGALNYQYFTKGDQPYLQVYAANPLAGINGWSYLNTLGYSPDQFYANQNALLGKQGYNFTDYATLFAQQQAQDAQKYLDSLTNQQTTITDQINNYIDQLSQAMTPSTNESKTTTSAATSSGTGLPAGFQALPMPAEYYGFAAAAQPQGTTDEYSSPYFNGWTQAQDADWIKQLGLAGLGPMSYYDYVANYGPSNAVLDPNTGYYLDPSARNESTLRNLYPGLMPQPAYNAYNPLVTDRNGNRVFFL